MEGIFQASRHDGGRRGQAPGFSIPRTLTKDVLLGVRPSALGHSAHPGEGGCRSLRTWWGKGRGAHQRPARLSTLPPGAPSILTTT